MSGILDKFQAPKLFRPQSLPDFLALQLARRLGEPEAIGFYLQVVRKHDRTRILKTYRRLIHFHPKASELASEFARRIEGRK